MATLTIRKLDDDVHDQLRVRAAHNRRSMEEEARAILKAAVTSSSPPMIWATARALFDGEEGVELELPTRNRDRPVPDFS